MPVASLIHRLGTHGRLAGHVLRFLQGVLAASGEGGGKWKSIKV